MQDTRSFEKMEAEGWRDPAIAKGNAEIALLKGQPADRREAIRAYLAERVQSEGVRSADGYFVPAPSAIVSGVRRQR